MNQKKDMDKKFQEGLDLVNANKIQEGAEIWMQLAEQGHLTSIREVFHIFLDQKEFEVAQNYLLCAANPNDPTILYLQARLIEERDGLEAAVKSFGLAAEAGHAGAICGFFAAAIENRDIATATYHLGKLRSLEDDLAAMTEPTKIVDLEKQVEDLHKSLSKILPVYFVLASGRWMRTRDEINCRYEDEEVWEHFLDEHNLTLEAFNRYEKWWISPEGKAVVEKVSSQFIAAILEETSRDSHQKVEDFLSNYANWDDFIRELSQCVPEDAVAGDSSPSYFAEYALQNGLCDPVSTSPDFEAELITEIANSIESWFVSNYEVAQSILLSAYDEITRVCES